MPKTSLKNKPKASIKKKKISISNNLKKLNSNSTEKFLISKSKSGAIGQGWFISNNFSKFPFFILLLNNIKLWSLAVIKICPFSIWITLFISSCVGLHWEINV